MMKTISDKKLIPGYLDVACKHIFTILIAGALSFAAFSAIFYHLRFKNHPTIYTGIWIAVLFSSAAGCICFFRNIPYPEKARTAILLIVISGIMFRVIPVVLINNQQMCDCQVFNEFATGLASGKGFAYTGETGLMTDIALFHNNWTVATPLPTAFRPPGAPFLYASVYAVAGVNPLYAKLLNVFFGTLTGVLLFFVIKPFNIRFGFYAGILWQILPSSIIATNLVCSEVPFSALLILSVVLLNSGKNNSRFAGLCSIALSGFTAGYASLTRPATQFLACGMAAISQRSITLRKKFLTITIFVCAASVPLIFWGVRNYRLFGVFQTQPSQIGMSIDAMTRRWYVSPDYEKSLDSLNRMMHTLQNEFELEKTGRIIGIKRLKRSIREGRLPIVWAKNTLVAWGTDTDMLEWCSLAPYPDEICGREIFFKPATGFFLKIITNSIYLFVLLISVAGIIRMRFLNWRENPAFVTLIIYLLLSFIIGSVFRGPGRYHFPLMPIICLFAAYGIGAFPWVFNNSKKSNHIKIK
jgi:hypothetical protein